jgi:hypothetical protein
MVQIRFLQDRVVRDGHEGTPHQTRFAKGQVADLSEASANHWLSRAAAERVAPAAEPPEPGQQGLALGDPAGAGGEDPAAGAGEA